MQEKPKKVGRDYPLSETPAITYKNLGLARTATNNAEGRSTNAPATARDSADYRSGFKSGLKGKKVSDLRKKYEGTNEYVEKGRWEGQNAIKKK